MMSQQYDIIILGAGISGVLATTVMAHRGYNVLLLEKDALKRPEPLALLCPDTLEALIQFSESIGLGELSKWISSKLAKAKFPFKVSHTHIFHSLAQPLAYQAEQLDKQVKIRFTPISECLLKGKLMALALKKGAQIKQQAWVNNVEFTDDYGLVFTQGEEQAYQGRFVIDATGRASFLANHMGLRLTPPEGFPLNTRCIFSQFSHIPFYRKGSMRRSTSRVSKLSRIEFHHFDGGLFWFKSLSKNMSSVGVSLNNRQYPMNELLAEEEFNAFSAQVPWVQTVIDGAKQEAPFIKTGRLQYMNRRYCAKRWALLPCAGFSHDILSCNEVRLPLQALGMLTSTLGVVLEQEQERCNYDRLLKTLFSHSFQAAFRAAIKRSA